MSKISDSTIIKHRHEKYTTLPRRVTSGEAGLSLRAIGLMAHLMGMPDDWKTWSRAVAKRFKCSRRVVLTTLKELRKAGYAKLDFETRDAAGRGMGRAWRISDEPEFRIPNEGEEAVHRNAPKTELRFSPKFGKHRNTVKTVIREKEPIQNSNLGQSTHSEQKTNKKPQTTNGSAASPTPPLNGHVVSFSDLPANEQLVQVWQTKYRRWYGIPYRLRGTDEASIEDYLSSNPTQQELTSVMHTAMAAWIDLAKAPPRPSCTEHDSFFYRRTSDKLGYVLRNIVGLQQEMEQSRRTAYGEPHVAATIQQGKASYVSNGS